MEGIPDKHGQEREGLMFSNLVEIILEYGRASKDKVYIDWMLLRIKYT